MIIIAVDKQSSDRVIQGKQRGKSLKKKHKSQGRQKKEKKNAVLLLLFI
jgi:hypothetical protein